MEQIRCTPVKDKIHALNDGLELLHIHLSVLTQENFNEMGMLLAYIGRVAEHDEISPRSFFLSDQATQLAAVNEISPSLSNLMEKVTLLNSEIESGHLILRRWSVIPWPKTPQELGGAAFVEKEDKGGERRKQTRKVVLKKKKRGNHSRDLIKSQGGDGFQFIPAFRGFIPNHAFHSMLPSSLIGNHSFN